MKHDSAWHRLLLPLTPLYRGAVRARIAAYDRGWLPSSRLPAPVVSVGNLTFGGTGKTPTVIALVRDLVRRGRHPAVLTRGYGRSVTEPVVLIGPTPTASVDEAGDEPLELAHRLPGVPIVVDADRVRGGIEALTRGADILVLDDGYQHLKLERDLNLALVDAGDPWGGGRMAPGGRLREPIEGLARADAVLVTKVPPDGSEVLTNIREVVEEIAPDLPVFAARLEPTAIRRPTETNEPAALDGNRVLAVAALGRPEGFAELLRGAGAEVVETRWYPDHHAFTQHEIDEAVGRAGELEAVVATTAKDAVKMPRDAAVWVVEASMVPLSGSWDELWDLLPEVEP
jgi:tetraacyldisaccharide 4'-kinase